MTRTPPGWLALPAAAVVWWLIGFLPWLVHGAHRTGRPAAPSRPIREQATSVRLSRSCPMSSPP